MSYHHIPVMLEEVLENLEPQLGEYFVDGTLGGAGYTLALAKAVGHSGRVLAIDLDETAINNAKSLIADNRIENIVLVQDNFRNLEEIVHKNFGANVQLDGLVLDLGLSSVQVDEADRGFSFLKTAPLSLAFDKRETKNAAYLINNLTERELLKILNVYGEEKFAFRIMKKIINARKEKEIETTTELADIVSKSVPASVRYQKIHPATKTFQALRLAVNQELESLELVLPQAIKLLKPGGRLAVVSFHSLEDRIVKNFFRDQAKTCVCGPEIMICNCHHEPIVKIITKKVLIPSESEVKANPRARSAKLRVAEKI
ncbi:16S rRNA (cytosine(1402)-N(4))-methyltransferase [Candidatus Falkowbacteria bacterium CG1_02_41_21]|uniref:Ribosomal RNA small subunit methyltransferase H n=1 Tax=Candidatus Falkowbacteria bacterium CG1_02_41_21 TaxID=1805147 RepID=A0A1J4TCH8_9BACT|nr:MAG: 16S rRNA (cytosine(1402)-N(4))-methyltransferase [Candidatus Falkowbacteria bacterium CG1_02_41_21]